MQVGGSLNHQLSNSEWGGILMRLDVGEWFSLRSIVFPGYCRFSAELGVFGTECTFPTRSLADFDSLSTLLFEWCCRILWAGLA